MSVTQARRIDARVLRARDCGATGGSATGFLFRQLVVRARLGGGGIRGAVAATAFAAALFSVSHIPARIHQGYHGLDLVATLVVAALGGALVSLLYVRSGNLLFIVVLHTLFNDQVPLFVSPVPPQWMLCVLAMGVIVWIEIGARRRAQCARASLAAP